MGINNLSIKMKRIYLAKKGKRVLARIVDLLITFALTIFIFLVFVFPVSLDSERLNENGEKIITLYKETGLFIVDEAGNYNANCAFQNITKLEDLYSVNCTFNGKEYSDISLTKSLYIYYTTQFANYGNQFNLSVDAYKSQILKIGSAESNIADYDVENNKLILIDEEKQTTTINYFVDVYASACKNLISNSEINTLTNENQKILLDSIIWIIPVLLCVTFIFELLIPLLSPCCETIGKHLFKLGVLSHDGYRLKKGKLILRWLCYVLIEVVVGCLTFGATVLITYTMFLFTKKRRCMHDYVAKTVVIEKSGSIYFASKEEETFYINYMAEREGGENA